VLACLAGNRWKLPIIKERSASEAESAILNLERGHPVKHWGRLILYVTDMDAFWVHLKEKGFDPEMPRDGAWGERYFHMPDPDGHELSFARPLR
jgi:uncharacterized glyoxalase superfamily protein PhnB